MPVSEAADKKADNAADVQMAVTAITFWRTVGAVLKSLAASSWRTRSMAAPRGAVGVRVGLRGSNSVRPIRLKCDGYHSFSRPLS